MLEALVVGGVEEDLGLQAAAGVAVVHGLPAAGLVPALVQRRTDIIHRHLRKWRCISLLAHKGGHLKDVINFLTLRREFVFLVRQCSDTEEMRYKALPTACRCVIIK